MGGFAKPSKRHLANRGMIEGQIVSWPIGYDLLLVRAWPYALREITPCANQSNFGVIGLGPACFSRFCSSIFSYSPAIIAPKTGGQDNKWSSDSFIKAHETTTLDDVAKR